MVLSANRGRPTGRAAAGASGPHVRGCTAGDREAASRCCQNSKLCGDRRKPPQSSGRGSWASPYSSATSADRRSSSLRLSTTWLWGDATALSWLPAAGSPRTRGLLRRRAFGVPFDPHLATERVPIKEHRRSRVGLELAALAALVVGVEREPSLVVLLEQHHAHGWHALDRARGHHDRTGLPYTRALGIPVPRRTRTAAKDRRIPRAAVEQNRARAKSTRHGRQRSSP